MRLPPVTSIPDLLILTSALLAVGACGSEEPTSSDREPAALDVVTPSRALFGIGDTLRIQARFVDGSGAVLEGFQSASVLWQSDDPAVIRVDENGLLTAGAEGATRIRVASGDLSADERFWVVRDETGIIVVDDVTLLSLDGSGDRPGQSIVVDHGVITAIVPTGAATPPPDAVLVDGEGSFAIPGLVDAHTHPKDPLDLPPYLANGVTTIVNLGHSPAQTPVLQWRDQVNGGSLLGPTIYSTRQILDGANPRAIATIVTTPEAARAAVRDQVRAGVDFIKTYNDLSVPVFEAIMDEANGLGVSVISHGVRAPGLGGVLDGGVVAIAHAEEVFYTHFGSTIEPDLISSAVAAMAESEAWLMPNLSTFERVEDQWGNTAALDLWLAAPEARYLAPWHTTNWGAFHRNVYAGRTGSVAPILTFLSDLTRAMHEGGVPFVLATDSPIIPGMFPGYTIHDDLRLLVDAGLTPEEALRVGTVDGARFIGTYVPGAGDFGTLTVGARADLVLLPGDPRLDLEVLRHPRGVMTRGRYLSNYRLEQILEDLASSWGR